MKNHLCLWNVPLLCLHHQRSHLGHRRSTLSPSSSPNPQHPSRAWPFNGLRAVQALGTLLLPLSPPRSQHPRDGWLALSSQAAPPRGFWLFSDLIFYGLRLQRCGSSFSGGHLGLSGPWGGCRTSGVVGRGWVLELTREEQRRKRVPTPAVTSVRSSFKRLDDN